MSDEEQELKSCPFCNGAAVNHYTDDYDWVECSGCGATSNPKSNRGDAIKLWNSRYNTQDLEYDVNRLQSTASELATELEQVRQKLLIKDSLLDEQLRTIKALMDGTEEHTGKQGTSAVLLYIARLEQDLEEAKSINLIAAIHIEKVEKEIEEATINRWDSNRDASELAAYVDYLHAIINPNDPALLVAADTSDQSLSAYRNKVIDECASELNATYIGNKECTSMIKELRDDVLALKANP